ncbi:tRNA-binding protein [Salsuginibacillus halophilus]|uniref:tRNA-binding protein n=1 Tax=Salsuginibacillus halophilus TaxID=517424 RepID=A0A2P8HE93_9BACI|nr:DUF4479 domain-containing protein [Salsuginibacillus halophilus]PSL44540.1 tRNA-binding protein [Salsuginibacillus halophilus]
MNVFYNPNALGDVLLVAFEEVKKDERIVRTYGDVAVLLHTASNQVCGLNIFHASHYGKVSGNGMIPADEAIRELIQKAVTSNKVEGEVPVPQASSFVVGYVKEKKKHPEADKLSICQVDTGEDTLQIVCGAPNVATGQKVPVALPGAFMPSGMKIEDTELRGVPSSGMICAARELAQPNASKEKGILVLDESAPVGGDAIAHL